MKKFVIKLNKPLLIKVVLFSVVFLHNYIFEVNAATINAGSCEYVDVQEAINSASSGDTVIVPNGSCTWPSTLTITKAINLIGAGIGNTIINSTHVGSGSNTASDAWAGLLVKPTMPSDNPIIRVSGFTFNFSTYNYGIIYKNISTTYELTNTRFDHLEISAGSSGNMKYVFQWVGMAHGVVDNCQIRGKIGNCCNNLGLWSVNNAAAAYEHGDESVLYFEDNTWTAFDNSTNFNASGNGHIRYVFRYNDITLPSIYEAVSPLWDQHQQCFGAEIYGNDINIPNVVWWFSDQRGGKWLWFNNNVTYTETPAVRIRQESENYTTQAYNGQPQRTADSYYWGNRLNNSTIIGANAGQQTYHSSLGRNVPLENYDFWNFDTSFDGTTGIGCGTLANRPPTCTTGVGYWATDQSITDLTGMVGANPSTPISGTLYRCIATNTWSIIGDGITYTPYTYPHPLRTNGAVYEYIINVYPNPCRVYQGENIITFFGDLSTGDNIKVFDMSGKTVHDSGALSEATYEWNVSDIVSGVYFFVVKSSDGETKTSDKIAVIR